MKNLSGVFVFFLYLCVHDLFHLGALIEICSKLCWVRLVYLGTGFNILLAHRRGLLFLWLAGGSWYLRPFSWREVVIGSHVDNFPLCLHLDSNQTTPWGLTSKLSKVSHNHGRCIWGTVKGGKSSHHQSGLSRAEVQG